MLHRELTLVCFGDAGVGKSSLLRCLVDEHGNAVDEEMNCLFDTQQFEFKVDSSFTCVLTLRNTSGKESLLSMKKNAVQECDGVLVCFSLADSYSFESVSSKWLPEIRQLVDKDVPILLVGTKADKKKLLSPKASSASGSLALDNPRTSKRYVSVNHEDALALAKKHKLVGFFETSAREGKQVNEAIMGLLGPASHYKIRRLQSLTPATTTTSTATASTTSSQSPTNSGTNRRSFFSRISQPFSRSSSTVRISQQLVDNAGDGDTNACLELLARGAQVSFAGVNKITPLHAASRSGKTDVVNVLLYAGADIELRDNTGATALHLASFNGHVDCVRALLDRSANIHAENLVASTPLHEASSGGHRDVCTLLVERGANVEAKDVAGHTPRDRATFSGHPMASFFNAQS